MSGGEQRTVAVCGATGRQGGAVTRSLLGRGWTVRALTRRPEQPAARTLANLGATVVTADMDDPDSLRRAFEGADGVFSVQNGMVAGFEREVDQGRNVADAANSVGVSHLVYGSAGTGHEVTGIPSWDAKRAVEKHMGGLGLPVTILRPMAFMELLTDKAFYPAVGTWRLWPRLTGEDRPIVWLAVSDLGAVAAIAFAEPGNFVGRDLALAADVKTLAECRSIYRKVTGHEPRSFPMPVRMFDRFTRRDVTTMWRWLRTNHVDLDTEPTRAVLPSALTVEQWLAGRRKAPT